MICTWKTIDSLNAEGVSAENFFKGISVWISRPHIINRKIIGVEITRTSKVLSNVEYDSLFEMVWKCGNFQDMKEDLFKELNVQIVPKIPNLEERSEETHSYSIVQNRLLLSKSSKFQHISEILLIDNNYTKYTFVPKTEEKHNSISVVFPYQIVLKNNKIVLSVPEELLANQQSLNWLKAEVLPKICNWSKNIPQTPVMPSLQHVNLQRYNEKYNHLKEKYGKKLVESWPESTDPVKFVYEDIATAAYIITLWEEENIRINKNHKQSFVELGCGNGLLVHLLSSEGYPGIGIDVRKRNIWDMYGPETKLIEKVVVPSDKMLFPEYDWIIGNHSDELTPWIPVIASRSSYSMRVFLLPCCCFTFDGKYDRKTPNLSKYHSYLNFIMNLCEVFGFNVIKDKLRIPSTKRICFVCSSRNYKPQDEDIVNIRRTGFIKKYSKCQNYDMNREDKELWASGFQPRENVEVIRNCSTLDQNFKDETVHKIAKNLLSNKDFVEIETDNGKLLWNKGGKIHLKDLAESLGPEILHKLKAQYGGLQTLLRNHKNIFKVQQAVVSIAIPSEQNKPKESKKKKNIPKTSFREKKCYFHYNHPQGCPLPSIGCSFSHIL